MVVFPTKLSIDIISTGMVSERRIPTGGGSPLGMCLYFVLFMLVGISGRYGVVGGKAYKDSFTILNSYCITFSSKAW